MNLQNTLQFFRILLKCSSILFSLLLLMSQKYISKPYEQLPILMQMLARLMKANNWFRFALIEFLKQSMALSSRLSSAKMTPRLLCTSGHSQLCLRAESQKLALRLYSFFLQYSLPSRKYSLVSEFLYPLVFFSVSDVLNYSLIFSYITKFAPSYYLYFGLFPCIVSNLTAILLPKTLAFFKLIEIKKSLDCQFYRFLRLSDKEVETLIYQADQQPHIHINHLQLNRISAANFQVLDKTPRRKCEAIINSLLDRTAVVDSIEVLESNLILHVRMAGKQEYITVPIELEEEVSENYNKVQMMYLRYRQNYYIQQREELLQRIEELNSQIKRGQEEHSNRVQFKQNQTGKKHPQCNCKQLQSRYEMLEESLRISQDKYEFIAEINKKLQQRVRELSIRQLKQEDEKRSRYLVHRYENHTSIQLANRSTFSQKDSSSAVTDNHNEFGNLTDYFEANQQKPPIKTLNGLNEFVFKPFTIGKYISCFKISENSIKFKEKSGIYYQITSFYGVPLTGKTKIGFRVISSRGNNILVGVLLTIRKRLKFSYQHSNMISYKMKGGKLGLFEDGYPSNVDCQEVRSGECLWMVISREDNTIEFTKGSSLLRTMPVRFKTAPLFPFVTMKDQGDEVQIL